MRKVFKIEIEGYSYPLFTVDLENLMKFKNIIFGLKKGKISEYVEIYFEEKKNVINFKNKFFKNDLFVNSDFGIKISFSNEDDSVQILYFSSIADHAFLGNAQAFPFNYTMKNNDSIETLIKNFPQVALTEIEEFLPTIFDLIEDLEKIEVLQKIGFLAKDVTKISLDNFINKDISDYIKNFADFAKANNPKKFEKSFEFNNSEKLIEFYELNAEEATEPKDDLWE